MNAAKDVLVVEDNPDMAEMMLYVLRGAGYPARSAENGAQALDAVATDMPGLVLLDMRMPVMDGPRCARELRARYGRAVPIVMVSAAEQFTEVDADTDVDEVLQKPFELRDLLELVSRYVARAEDADSSS